MKKLFAMALVIVMVGAMLGACAPAATTAAPTTVPPTSAPATSAPATSAPATKANGDWKIVMVTPYGAVPYWQEIESGMNAANKDLGTKVEYIGPSDLNLDQQLQAIDTSIASKVDGIITNGYVPDTFAPYFAKAKAAGIPVVLVDADAPNSARTSYIGTSNEAAGEEAGKAMAKATNGKAVIGILTGPLDSVNLNQRIDGFKKAISSYPDMKVVTTEVTNVDLNLANEKTVAMLAAYPDMNAIFGSSQVDIVGAGQVVESKGLKGMTLIGFDDIQQTLDYIKKGIVYGTIVQKPFTMGYKSVQVMLDILNGKPVDQIYDTGVTVVTKDNVDTYKNNP